MLPYHQRATNAASLRERAALEAQLAPLLERLQRTEARHGRQPEHIKVGEIELDGRPVHHTTEFKTLIDTLRVAGANAESELADRLAPHLLRPSEAKRCLQNLFAAAGDIKIAKNSITITLDPAGNSNEKESFVRLFATVNRWKLHHPGDPERRPLLFRVQNG